MMLPQEARKRYWTKGPDDQIIVLCDHVNPTLMRSYGPTRSYGLDQALEGEKRGLWRIRRKEEAQVYETKVLTAGDLGRGEPHATKGIKKKTVVWVQDQMIRGGAEISNELVIRVGRNLGYDITVINQDTDMIETENAIKNADLAVINNIFGFGYYQMRVIDQLLISGKIPYVKYDHDHRELTRDGFARKLFQNSILNVFLSPLHLGKFKKHLSVDGISLPLAIDTDFFKPVPGVERKPSTAIICNIKLHKGYSTLQKYVFAHPEISFTVVGKQHPLKGKNITWRNQVPYEEMAKIYSSFEFIVHLLDKWGAGERVILEACLCGCKVIANEKVGHMTWGRELVDSDGLREWLKQAPYDFWKEVNQRDQAHRQQNNIC